MNASESYAMVDILRFKADNLKRVAYRDFAPQSEGWKSLMREAMRLTGKALRLQEAIDEANLALAGVR